MCGSRENDSYKASTLRAAVIIVILATWFEHHIALASSSVIVTGLPALQSARVDLAPLLVSVASCGTGGP